MTSTAPKLRTFEDVYAEIEALPGGMTGEILEPGVVHITMGRPGRPHRFTAKRAARALTPFDRDVGGTGWWIEVEAEVRFGDRMLDPDLAGWRVERVPELPMDNPIAILPDWCCEFLSPSTARIDRLVKLPRYAREGVPWVWLVDPVLRSVEVYETDPKGRPILAIVAEQSDAVVLPPFEGPIDFGAWWLPAPAPAPEAPPVPVPVRPLRAGGPKRTKRGKR